MPRCTTRIFEAHKIPDGSTVKLWTEGEAGEFDTAALVEADAERWTIPHDQLFRPEGDPRPPAEFPALSPQRYVVTFFTSFRSAAETEVGLNLQLVTGQGTRKVVNCSVAGQHPDSDHRIVFLKTLKN